MQAALSAPHPTRCLPSTDRATALSVRHTPRQNHILAALPQKDYERLLPDLDLVSLPLGWTISHADQRQEYLYFPTEGIVSQYLLMASGASAESSVIGNEGVVGIALFLGGNSTPSHAVVLSPGYAYRLRIGLIRADLEPDGPLMRLLLRYTLALIWQTGQIAACNRHHSLRQQLCRHILSNLDRLPSNELVITHELIANMLGVRREGVTQAAGILQKEGLIHCHRGHIAVLDRSRLEAQACECYAAIKRAYAY